MEETKEQNSVIAFSFGDPEPVLTGYLSDYLGVWLVDNGKYYTPPVSLTGMARLLRANAYHGPLIEFKTNMVMRGFRASNILPRREMYALATDYNVFANGYLQLTRNWFGEVIAAKHLPAINMRRASEAGRYGLIDDYGRFNLYGPAEVVHIKNYDVTQTIYGIPWYLGAIQSMLLNEDATLFRRRYYKNGAHVGYIFYSASAALDDAAQTAIKNAVQNSKGVGNFKNMFMHIPNGREKDIQILPVGDFSAKDELQKIKSLSRDDIIAAHRIPPAMANIIPENQAGFGDITKIDAVYEKNEVSPVRDLLLEVNAYLPPLGRVSFDNSTI